MEPSNRTKRISVFWDNFSSLREIASELSDLIYDIGYDCLNELRKQVVFGDVQRIGFGYGKRKQIIKKDKKRRRATLRED